MKIIKKLLVLFIVLLMTVYSSVLAGEGGSDLGGTVTPGGGVGDGSGAKSGYSLAALAFLRVSLVNVKTLEVKSNIYYRTNTTATNLNYAFSKTHFMKSNFNGAGFICGYITPNSYSDECRVTDETNFSDALAWPRSWYSNQAGLTFNARGLKNEFCGTGSSCIFSDFFKDVITILVEKCNLFNTSDWLNYDNYSVEQRQMLKDYRIVVEPVYAFKRGSNYKYVFATLKGISATVVKNYDNNQYDPKKIPELFIGAFSNKLISNVYASSNHGLIIGKNNYQPQPDFSLAGQFEPNYISYYRALADVRSGYGYGMFYVIENDCDPESECCYDSNGNYNKDYYGGSSNYRCKDGINGETCKDIEYCEQKKICQEKDEVTLNCAKEHIYNSSCTHTISQIVSVPSECTTGTGVVSANIVMNQTGKLTFGLPTTDIYSGGGFEYGIEYINTAYWNYENYPVCPSITAGFWGPYYCSAGDSLSGTTCTHTETDNSDPDKPVTTTTTYPASRDCNTYEAYAKNCRKDSDDDARNIIKEIVKKSYITLENSSVTVMMPDSNNANGGTNSYVGSWNCNSANSSYWSPGTVLTSNCNYTLRDAYIKRDSGEVYYGNYYNSNNYLYEGAKYFTPLKYYGDFPVEAVGIRMSSISGINWGFNYNCGVNCIQEFYDDKGYLFYYRPITLSEPFPNNREPGYNWYSWYIENRTDLLNRLSKTYNNLEYTVVLTNEKIAEIKAYNKAKVYNRTGYLDFSINPNGASQFINGSSFITRNNPTYCYLGEGCGN